MMKQIASNFIFSLLIIPKQINAGLGDLAAQDFSCPVFATCPVACAERLTDCPMDVACPENTTLCIDGSCASLKDGGCSPDLINPCEFECAPIACVKVNDYLDNCEVIYGPLYDYARNCMYWYWDNLNQVNQTGPTFIFFYTWISTVTLLVYCWCAFNQRLKPVAGSTQELQEAVAKTSGNIDIQNIIENPKEDNEFWTQTAYKRHIIGDIAYVMTIITLVTFHILLGILTVFYYWTEEGILLNYEPLFADDAQVLFVFEVVWMIGFFWSLAFKWNSSVRSIFFRRCHHHEAQQIAVFAPEKDPTSEFHTEHVRLSTYYQIYLAMKKAIASVSIFLFSDVNRPSSLGSYKLCPVVIDSEGNKFFSFRQRRYLFDEKAGKFVPGHTSVGESLLDIINGKDGLTTEQVMHRTRVIGKNTMDLPKPNFLQLVIDEFGKPFYHYQMYMVWTWFPLWYFYMAAVNTIVILISGISVAYFLHKNQKNIYSLSKIEGLVSVLRNGTFNMMNHTDLVPGDIVQIKTGIAYSDMVVLSGEKVVTDESALTGETTPIIKMKLEDIKDRNQPYNSITFKQNTIFAGTKVTEAGSESLAIVTKTGSFTAKGELIRDILSYRRHVFKFDVEVKLVLVILFIWAIICFSFVIWFVGDDPVYSWFYGMFVVSTCIPILLPTVFVVSVGISEKRLAKVRIACTNPNNILVAGKVKVAFFDKTGTLTKQGLDFHSVRSRQNWSTENHNMILTDPLTTAMAVCHGIFVSQSAEVVGNAVDKVMFQATEATLMNTENATRTVKTKNGQIFTIVKQFDFNHHRMTQSVIVKDENGKMIIFVKGSSESIMKLCESSSMPTDFEVVSKDSARQGIYQISVAMKSLPHNLVNKIKKKQGFERDEVEKKLTFIGMINFKNLLKPESRDVLSQLRGGGIKTIMLTGDNVYTGVKIAVESGMIGEEQHVILGDKVSLTGEINWHDPTTLVKTENPISDSNISTSDIAIAVTGNVWRHLCRTNQAYALQLCEFIRVYGRCTPIDKVSVVSTFVHKGDITLMCGDGGNDCGALKTAHVGIALSDTDASTVSPFTSLDKSIGSVIDVLKEGRCALASAFASYKYILMYGQVSTINQLVISWFYTTFSEWSWIFLDGVWLVTMVFTIPLAKPAKVLSAIRPTSSLFGWYTLTSYLGVLIINALYMVVALTLLFGEDWYYCRMWDDVDTSEDLMLSDNYETEVVFIITGFQYIISALVYNFGFTQRELWVKNYIFVFFAIIFVAIHFYITLVPGYFSCVFRVNCDNDHIVRELTTLRPLPIENPFHTTVMPPNFRTKMIIVMVLNFISITVWEYYIVNGLIPSIINRFKRLKNISTTTTTNDGKLEADLESPMPYYQHEIIVT